MAEEPDRKYLRPVPRLAIEQDDATLVDAVRRGDERALTALYERHAPVVMGIASRIVGDAAGAETVLLDTFAQAWRDAARYDSSRGSVLSWLVTIARSRALDAARASSRQARVGSISVDETPDDLLTAEDLSSNPEPMMEARERRSAVVAALKELPANQRTAIELAYFMGMSQSEIAERLGEPLGTVKTRIRLGMTKLRELLGAYAGGGEAIA